MVSSRISGLVSSQRSLTMLQRKYYLIVPTLTLLAGAASVTQAGAQSVQVVTPMPVQTQAPSVVIAPNAPPPTRVETIPPPPPGAGPVVWQPGHWQYTGTPGRDWAWQPGQYVQPPYGQTTWIPGHWAQQPNGAWTWVEGHWA
jgi:hypothetical protein